MADLEKINSETVTLKGMRFHARIGVLPHEAEIAQSVEVDATLEVVPRVGAITQRNIVDYRVVYELVANVLEKGHIGFLEDAADRIASEALELTLVRSVRIAIRKPNVVMPGPLTYAEVTVERTRA